eukprot:1158089-Amorphochlora_amoeboformis.AAC.1
MTCNLLGLLCVPPFQPDSRCLCTRRRNVQPLDLLLLGRRRLVDHHERSIDLALVRIPTLPGLHIPGERPGHHRDQDPLRQHRTVSPHANRTCRSGSLHTFAHRKVCVVCGKDGVDCRVGVPRRRIHPRPRHQHSPLQTNLWNLVDSLENPLENS